MLSTGILIIRLVFGLTFAAHGAQKLLGWFGGPGLSGFAGWLESMGLKPAKFQAILGSVGEVVGGLLLAFGIWTPIAAVLIVATMIVAIAKVHGPKGYWVTGGGYEYNLAIIAVAVGLALIGPGDYTLQSLLH